MSNAISTGATPGWRNRQFIRSSMRVTQWTFAALRLVLLLACGFLVTWLVNYNPLSWDLTANREYSLSVQTRSVLDTLATPVSMTLFVNPAGDQAAVERRLRTYAEASSLVEYSIVDPEAEPALAAKFQILEFNTLVVEASDRVRVASSVDEPGITNAILSATRGEPVRVCFLSGHGERNPTQRQREGLSAAATALSQTNYTLTGLNLAAADATLDDCRVTLLSGPTTDLLPIERERLEAYLDGGGRLLALIESGTQVPEINSVLARYGVTVNDDHVIDTRRNGQMFSLSNQAPMVDEYAAHPITENFGAMTLFSLPRSLSVAQTPPDGFDVRALAQSTTSSWGEKTFDRSSIVRWDEETEQQGPLALMVAVAKAVEETPRLYRDRMRAGLPAPVGDPVLVAFGDIDFASNEFFAWQGNGDLFLNSINWLAGQDDLIAIRPRAVANKRVLLTNGRRALSFVLLVVLLPLVPAMTGAVMMIKKVK